MPATQVGQHPGRVGQHDRNLQPLLKIEIFFNECKRAAITVPYSLHYTNKILTCFICGNLTKLSVCLYKENIMSTRSKEGRKEHSRAMIIFTGKKRVTEYVGFGWLF
ncbi:MAG: hypothetical protein ABIN01_13010 [Ferruginibacter sp.]